MNYKNALLLCILLLIPYLVLSQTQCKVTKGIGGKFRVRWSDTSNIAGGKRVLIDIGLKGSQFSEAYLRKVAQRIRETYCNEIEINAVIIDMSDRRKYDDLTPPPVYPPSTRALYFLDRTSGEERLQFYRDEKYGATIELN